MGRFLTSPRPLRLMIRHAGECSPTKRINLESDISQDVPAEFADILPTFFKRHGETTRDFRHKPEISSEISKDDFRHEKPISDENP